MQVSVTFDPLKDPINLVQQAVAAAYGPKSTDSTVTVGPVTVAPAQNGASLPDAAALANQLTAAVQAADQPNPLVPTAPTAPDSPASAGNFPAGVDLDKNGIPWDARIHSGGTNDDGTHKKTANGVWAKRKGVQDIVVSEVTKELQNLMASQVGHAAPPAGLPAGGVLGNPVNVPHQEAVPVAGQPDAYVIAPMPNMTQPPVQQPGPSVQPAPAMNVPAAMVPVGQLTPDLAAQPAATQDAPPLPSVAPMPMGNPPVAAPVAPTDYNSLAQWLARNLAPNGKLTEQHVEHFCRQCQIVDGAGLGQFALVQHRPDAIAWLYQAFTNQIAALG